MADEIETSIEQDVATDEQQDIDLLGDDLPEPLPLELNVPEGLEIPAETLSSFRDRCANLGLTQDQAEGILKWHASQAEQDALTMQQLPGITVENWRHALAADPEFGGEHLERTLSDGARALKRFDPDGSMRQYLIESGMQFHPAIVRMAARIGAKMREHDYVAGTGGIAGKAPLADRMYGGAE